MAVDYHVAADELYDIQMVESYIQAGFPAAASDQIQGHPALPDEILRHCGQEFAFNKSDVGSPSSTEESKTLSSGKAAIPSRRRNPLQACPMQRRPQPVPEVDCNEQDSEDDSQEQVLSREQLLVMRGAACDATAATEPQFRMFTKLRPLSWGTLVTRVLIRDGKCTLLDGLCLLGHSRHLAPRPQSLFRGGSKGSSNGSSGIITGKGHLASGLSHSTQQMIARILVRDLVWVSVFPDLARYCRDGLAARIGSATKLDKSSCCTIRIAVNPRCVLHPHGVRNVAFRLEALPQWSKSKQVQGAAARNLRTQSSTSSPYPSKECPESEDEASGEETTRAPTHVILEKTRWNSPSGDNDGGTSFKFEASKTRSWTKNGQGPEHHELTLDTMPAWRTMNTLDTLPDMPDRPDRFTGNQQWRTVNTFDTLPDMMDIMSTAWPPFNSAGSSAPAPMAGTPSSAPPTSAPLRQHWDSSGVAGDGLPLERFRKDQQRDRQQVVSLTHDSLPAHRVSNKSGSKDPWVEPSAAFSKVSSATFDSLPATRVGSATFDSLPVTRVGRDKGSTTYEAIPRVSSKDPFTAFTHTHDNFDGAAVGSRWGCGTRTGEDLPELPASGSFLAHKDSSPVPYIPTVDNFDCLGISRGQLGMMTYDELPPAPYTPTQDNLDMLGLPQRGCNGGTSRDHYIPTFDNFDHSGLVPASVVDAANTRTQESLPEMMQSMGHGGAGALQEPEQTFRWRA